MDVVEELRGRVPALDPGHQRLPGVRFLCPSNPGAGAEPLAHHVSGPAGGPPAGKPPRWQAARAAAPRADAQNLPSSLQEGLPHHANT